MQRVVQRPLAQHDLAEIWSYIADDSEAAADRFLSTLLEKLNLLASQPHMGRQRPELLAELRSFPVGRYVLFYKPLPDGIELVRVLHSARDTGLNDLTSGTAN